MSLSFDEAVATLQIMFPEWDKEMLSMILESNQYHYYEQKVERTIESVLSMSGGETSATSEEVKPSSNLQPMSIGNSADADDILIDILDESPSKAAATSSSSSSSSYISPAAATTTAPAQQKSAPSSSSRYRGIRCDLPDDFLRTPGWRNTVHRDVADEELARMLQDELFREQVRSVLGESFINNPAAGPGPVSRGSGSGGSHRPSRSESGPPHPSSSSSSSSSSSASSSDSTGMLRALAGMGTAAKKNLSQLAVRFRGGQGAEVGGGSKEFTQLVESGDKEDDDAEATEVLFQNHRTPVTKLGGRRSHLLQEDDDPNESFDSENPLLASSATNNVSIAGKKMQ